MARIQILELPEGAGDDRPPFLLVVDQLPADDDGAAAIRRDLTTGDIREITGARAILCFDDTIDIPANEVSLDENGHPLFLKVHVEGEFEQFREQVQDEIRKAQDELLQAISAPSRDITVDNAADVVASHDPSRHD